MKTFLPMSKYEMERLGWDQLDIILITGDAYIDHPSYGVAIIGRILEKAGYKTGIIAQPEPGRDFDFSQLGKPRIMFGVTAGNNDSMVANYSPNKKVRKIDNFTPGRIPGLRPDRAALFYARRIKQIFPDVPVVMGGLEASMRRMAHYDFWDDAVRKAFLADCGAEVLVYGHGEQAIVEVARCFERGEGLEGLAKIMGICFKIPDNRKNDLEYLFPNGVVFLPTFEEIFQDKMAFLRSFQLETYHHDPFRGKPLVQAYPTNMVVQTPPPLPLSTAEFDEIFHLPFTRTPHPKYRKIGAIPAFETVKFSLTTHRGCFANCSFCVLPQHQGRYISGRSKESVLEEIELFSSFHYFRGAISNVGGPVGNMYKMGCQNPGKGCERQYCLWPEPCPNLNFDHGPYFDLLTSILDIPSIKSAFVASGFRYDFLKFAPKGPEVLDLLLRKYTQKHLKISPEHISESVCRKIKKYKKEDTEWLMQKIYEFQNNNPEAELTVSPYFMASHPGSAMTDALQVALYLRDHKIQNNQIQDFVPVPGVASTCMFYTGMDPETAEPIYRPLSHRERKLQRALFHYYKVENVRYVYESLKEMGRLDLVGESPECLIKEAPEIIKFD